MSGAGSIELDAAVPTETTDARVAALVEGHFDFVWRLLRRLGLTASDADDAAQQVFMIATQKLDAIPPDSERSFLYGTAQRVAANARRGVERRREDARHELDARPAEQPGPDRQSEVARARDLLDELLSRLPAELARVLVLAEIEQLPAPEIAALEGIPPGTAASRLRRARAAFRKELELEQHRNPFGEGEP